ncbi:hypothetical protein GCM10022224_042190 [Nonomuraea antimicrobica]|uniref:VOC domain-containing protein n=1 Tax=Nonomuraea antimicrobica TaxID=561173 RepID=A0ABP7C0P7_9ACTN
MPKAAPLAPSGALAFQRSGDELIVTIIDLYADPERYRAEFQARGLDIDLSFTPGSPSIVGQLVYSDSGEGGQIEYAHQACEESQDGCEFALRIPADQAGNATLVLARPARPGEKYDSMGFADAPGELLHCVAFTNLTVGGLRAVLAERDGSIAEFKVMDGAESRRVGAAEVPDNWFVTDVWPWAPGKVQVEAGPERVKRANQQRSAGGDDCGTR